MDLTSALPVFLITLREGVEAALVVGIVLACLTKAQATHLHRTVYLGIATGLLGSLLLGGLLGVGIKAIGASDWIYAPALQQSLQGGIALVAITLLSWMLLWMTQQAKGLKSEVEQSVQSALQTNTTWGIFSLIFVAVLREGVETVLFIGAQIQQGWLPALGALGGLIGATLIGLLIFKGGVKINLRLFFQLVGVLLLLIVGGLVVTALRKFEASLILLSQADPSFLRLCQGHGDSCILGQQVWDLSEILPDRQFPGIVLKALFGYTQQLYLVQAIAYVAFLLSVGGLYRKSLNGRLGSQKPPQSDNLPAH
ncbi:MAG: FTR1 family iron permease [Acaryochloris sp. SU_5_25]|nr:FTR1 family iron permease [Acaryochloris sp. SU_5_25]